MNRLINCIQGFVGGKIRVILVLKEMRNNPPVRPHSGFMGRAELLPGVPILDFPSAPAPNSLITSRIAWSWAAPEPRWLFQSPAQ